MKTKFFLLILFLLTMQVAVAQIMFQQHYGGPDDETGNHVLQTSDGGYIVTGSTESYSVGGRDIYIIRTDEYGTPLWTKTYGGPGDDQSTSIVSTHDGGYAITGVTSSFGTGNYDMFLIRIDQNGDTLWTKKYGGTDDDEGSEIILTSDHGFLLLGTTVSYSHALNDLYCVKTDSVGDTLWTKTYYKKNRNYGSSIIQTNDNEYLITAFTSNSGINNSQDGFIIKINSEGDTLWTRIIDKSMDDRAFFAYEIETGDYFVEGVTNSIGAGGYDIFLAKYNNSGNELWFKTYGGLDDEWSGTFQKANDNGFILVGSTLSFGKGIEDVYLIKTNENGDTLWTRTYGGSNVDLGSCVKQTFDNGYIVSGYTKSYGNGYDIYLIKTNQEGVSGFEKIIQSDNILNVYPNPNNGAFIITLEQPSINTPLLLQLFNINGAKVFSTNNLFRNASKEKIELEELHSGMYFLKISGKNINASTKLIIQK